MLARTFDWDAAAQESPRPEHPRPRLTRPDWHSLNGVWEFATDHARIGLTNKWFDGRKLGGKIVVPFAYQYPMSGRDDKAIEEVVWYARSFEVPDKWIAMDSDLLLHFGAVDYACTVWVNGLEVGHNIGGHVPFSVDIAPFLRPGENRVCLRVEDPQDPYQPRGKQAVNGMTRGCDYYCTTGIWQSVWWEPVPCLRIEDVVITPLLADAEDPHDRLQVRVLMHAPAMSLTAKVTVRVGDRVVAEKSGRVTTGSADLTIDIPDAVRWCPENPHLYDLDVRLFDGEDLLDEVGTYAGLRKIEIDGNRLLLNGDPLFLKMVLDQGYWPQSGMTAPTDDALRADVEWCLKMGFNGARKHQKVEDPRWLYWCDRLGLLVWAEMANARGWAPHAEERLAAEWQRAVRRDVSHPCVIAWVPLNESWGVPGLEGDHPGQYAFVERLVTMTRRTDSTRPVIDNDGWEHTDVGDIFAIHDYTPTGDALRERYRETVNGGPMITKGWGDHPKAYFAKGARYRGQPVILSEVGGFLLVPPDLPKEKWDGLYSIYGTTSNPADLLASYRDIMEAIASLPFVSGFCYTQLTDIEQEINGLLTYDRQPKVEAAAIRAIHDEVFGR